MRCPLSKSGRSSSDRRLGPSRSPSPSWARTPSLSTACSVGWARPAVRVLTVLGRAALTQLAALPLIRQALEADPGTCWFRRSWSPRLPITPGGLMRPGAAVQRLAVIRVGPAWESLTLRTALPGSRLLTRAPLHLRERISTLVRLVCMHSWGSRGRGFKSRRPDTEVSPVDQGNSQVSGHFRFWASIRPATDGWQLGTIWGPSRTGHAPMMAQTHLPSPTVR
jgi:hypothetical protein